MSSIHFRAGRPGCLLPSDIPNTTVFNSRSSDILQIWRNSWSFLFPTPQCSSLSTLVALVLSRYHLLRHYVVLSFDFRYTPAVPHLERQHPALVIFLIGPYISAAEAARSRQCCFKLVFKPVYGLSNTRQTARKRAFGCKAVCTLYLPLINGSGSKMCSPGLVMV